MCEKMSVNNLPFRKLVRRLALALTFGGMCVTAAQADVIFKPNGDNSVLINNFVGFDPQPGNVLNVGVNTAAANFVAKSGPMSFNAFGQANVNIALQSSGGTPVIPGGYTLVFGLPETITGVTGTVGNLGSTATFKVDPTATAANIAGGGTPANYFELWRTGGTGGNNLAGTGFNTGTRVLAGTFTGNIAADGSFGTSTSAVPLDGFVTNNYSGQTTFGGTGNIGLKGTITFFDSNYFTTTAGESIIGSTINVTTQLQTPFTAVDPSGQFLTSTTTGATGAATVIAGAGLNGLGAPGNILAIGTNNGQGAQSVQVQQDANAVVTFLQLPPPPPPLPEPATLAVFGLMAGATGLVYRKRRNTES